MLPGDCFERVVTYPAGFGHIRNAIGNSSLPSLALLINQPIDAGRWPGKPARI